MTNKHKGAGRPEEDARAVPSAPSRDTSWPQAPAPEDAVAELAGCTKPWLIGVRHHSPACAAAMPALLDAAAPTVLLLELPVCFAPWIDWLGHADLQAPVALAAAYERSGDLSFYPFADFSPELAAVRWAVTRGVAVVPFDASSGSDFARVGGSEGAPPPSALEALLEQQQADSSESLWDQMVEARAPGATPEQIRRAALAVGWMLRIDDAAGPGIRGEDLRRESHMRKRQAEALGNGERAVALVGSYHAAALLPDPPFWREPDDGQDEDSEDAPVTSLVPYSYDLLDSRSGYPAGIRDPQLRQRLWQVLGDTAGSPTAVDCQLADCVVRICRHIRGEGHVAGVPDASETQRMMRDLATLRRLPAPGRRELLESLRSTLGQGEPQGRGRVIAHALEAVLVGDQRGQLPPGVPRSGLRAHVDRLFKELRLPVGGNASAEPVLLRLDPLRSALDRRREAALQRLAACGVPYAELREGEAAGGVETLTRVWTAAWKPATGATIDLAGLRGVTLAQAAEGVLQQRRQSAEHEDALSPAVRLAYTRAAAAAGLGRLVDQWLTELVRWALSDSGLAELMDTLVLVERLRRGHEPALPTDPNLSVSPDVQRWTLPTGVDLRELLTAAIRQVEGLSGSERLEDARALLELVRLREQQALGEDGSARLGWALDQLAAHGSDLMQGAAGALRTQLGREPVAAFAERMGSWVDAAVDADGQRRLGARLRGALIVASALFEADSRFCEGIFERVARLSDAAFLRRLPALRHGFEVLSPADRQRLLVALGDRLDAHRSPGQGLDAELALPPELLARYATADQVGRRALESWQKLIELPELSQASANAGALAASSVLAHKSNEPAADELNQLTAQDRWRLILGRERRQLPIAARRAASALDELYGAGHGEGSRGESGQGGGQEAAYPTVREWSEELEALFGESVREEVLGRAASGQHPAAVLELDPDRVRPSVALLEQVLSLKGALPEAHLPRLRKLVRRIVQDLVKALATRIRPALTGVTTPRPTRRPGGPLDLPRTLAANLKNVRRMEDGSPRIIPERLIFRARGRRSLEWHVTLVVDVSGSMEPSVIYAALMAAILSGMPAVSVSFVTFSTEVVDLSDHVSDPLALLLEVSVGGGTHIAKALRYARERLRVPNRTLVLVITDFEEGFSIGGLLSEVRALVASGARPLGLAALDDRGAPRYNRAVAEQVAYAGMPVAALTPLELARWVREQIR